MILTLKRMRFETIVLKSIKNKSKKKERNYINKDLLNIKIYFNLPSCGVLFEPSKLRVT